MAADPVVDEARSALAACVQGDACQRWEARQALRDRAETYITHLLDEVDLLAMTVRDLDQRAVREDPAGEVGLEAARLEVARLGQALEAQQQRTLRVLQLAARTARRRYEEGYADGARERGRPG